MKIGGVNALKSSLNIPQEVLKRGVGIAPCVYMSRLIGTTFAPLWSQATYPSHDLPRIGVQERQRQHTFRTRKNCLQAKKSTLLVFRLGLLTPCSGMPCAINPVQMAHVLCQYIFCCCCYLIRLRVSQPNFFFCSGRLQLESGCLHSVWRSVVRHPECHCSWKTDKYFCSCRSPLKIPTALMTAARISQALPFTC